MVAIKLKMVVAIIIPMVFVSLVLGGAYWLGGWPGLFILAVALLLVLEQVRASRRSEPSYALSRAQSPRLHNLMVEVSEKIELRKKTEIYLCRGCQARAYGWLGSKVALGIPLFDYLTVGEMKAVMAHELGHIKNGDYAMGAFLVVMLTSLRSMVSASKQAVLAGGSALFVILMGIAGAIVWILKGFIEIICLLFMRQGEFMADLHTPVFETEGKPTEFKRSLAKFTLLSVAEREFEKRVLAERVSAVRQGRLSLSKLLEKPHINRFHNWLRQVNFSFSDEMIEKVCESKRGFIRDWSSTHPLIGDRIRNLEILMSEYPIESKELDPQAMSTNARVLIQEVYADAVKSLYGHEELDSIVRRLEDMPTHRRCSKCGKRITIDGKDSFFDTPEDGNIICQDCLNTEKG